MGKKGESLTVVKKIVHNDITDANMCRALLFDWGNGIIRGNSRFYTRFMTIFKFIEESLISRYVLSLAKLFAGSKEASLRKLMELVTYIPDNEFELKLERYPESPQERIRQERISFFKNLDSHVESIKEIKESISPLRNIQRVHNNISWENKNGEITFDKTKE